MISRAVNQGLPDPTHSLSKQAWRDFSGQGARPTTFSGMSLDFETLYSESVRLGTEGLYEPALQLVERCVALRPNSASALAQGGALLLALGRPAQAVEPLRRALAAEPQRPDILNNLGSALLSLGSAAEALPYFRQALGLAPDYFDAQYNLAGALVSSEQAPEAIGHYEALLRRSPQSAPLARALAKALWKVDRLDEAEAAYKRAIALDPSNADAFAQFGSLLLERGRLDEAVPAFERAIRMAPQRVEFYACLAQVRPALAAAHLPAIEALADPGSARSEDDVIEANFTLGTIYAEQGDRARAFAHLVVANTHRRRFITYDEAETLASFDRIATTFDAAFLAKHEGVSDPSSLPVFIFGMPRSGTTLVEQILASHNAVYGAGELTLFEQILNQVLAPGGSIAPETMLAASPEQLREIGQRYAHALHALAPAGAARVTDKIPANFRYAGLIHMLLPQARMIHVRRDPVDTCVSCFSNHFAGDLSFAYDLAELGRYYRGYERLMEHWRTVLPSSAMLEVRYEEIVDDLEAQAKKIVAYCGLAWDDACLEFYKTERSVKTASVAQVRRPIYRTSVGYSREYGDLLDPLMKALDV